MKCFRKVIRYIFLIMLFSCIGIANDSQSSFVISNNGNFLFYNSPVITKVNKYIFIAFVNNKGDVIVNKYVNNNFNHIIDSYTVHKYQDKILTLNKKLNKNLKADDHSAPAIIYDNYSKKIFLATSYHGSDLFIYVYDKINNRFILYKHIKGNYTYPRFVNSGKELLLIVRDLKKNKKIKFANLVYFSSKDKFNKENIIKKALPNSVIYASRPFVFENKIYITYAYYFYQNNDMQGWKVLEFDTVLNKVVKEIDLSKFLGKKYFYNRPTAIAVDKDKILVASAYFIKRQDLKKISLYTKKNIVVIIEIDKNNLNKKIIHKNISMAPYYNTDVFIDKKLNYIYFDKNKVISNNLTYKYCCNYQYMLYPNVFKNFIIFAKVNNNKYYIRDFNNSIVLKIINEK